MNGNLLQDAKLGQHREIRGAFQNEFDLLDVSESGEIIQIDPDRDRKVQ